MKVIATGKESVSNDTFYVVEIDYENYSVVCQEDGFSDMGALYELDEIEAILCHDAIYKTGNTPFDPNVSIFHHNGLFFIIQENIVNYGNLQNC